MEFGEKEKWKKINDIQGTKEFQWAKTWKNSPLCLTIVVVSPCDLSKNDFGSEDQAEVRFQMAGEWMAGKKVEPRVESTVLRSFDEKSDDY